MGCRFRFASQPQLANGGGKQREKEKYVHMEKNASCLSVTDFYGASAVNTKKDNF